MFPKEKFSNLHKIVLKECHSDRGTDVRQHTRQGGDALQHQPFIATVSKRCANFANFTAQCLDVRHDAEEPVKRG